MDDINGLFPWMISMDAMHGRDPTMSISGTHGETMYKYAHTHISICMHTVRIQIPGCIRMGIYIRTHALCDRRRAIDTKSRV